MDPADLDRRTFEDIGRVYTDWDNVYVPSVSTVLNQLPTPKAVKDWKAKNDDWETQRDFKQSRGTLIHYECLDQLTDREMWDHEEESSQQYVDEEYHSPGRYEDDLDWTLGEGEYSDRPGPWDLIRRTRGITKDSVLGVEVYVINRRVGYAGQFDLLYVDRDNNTVLADIKTSKGCWDKFPLQLTAYKHAVDMPIDRIEVLRMNPDYHDWEVHSDKDWAKTDEQCWTKFKELRDQINDDQIAELRDRAEEHR